MVFLPIVQRELAVAARRRSTFWVRLLFACTGIAIACWILAVSTTSGLAFQSSGRPLFRAMAILSLVYTLFAGARFTADSLSAEKREGTLGLLFLTDLKDYDIILGKLVAQSLDAFYGLIGVLPALAIPLVMGGVTFTEYARVAAVLINVLLLSLTVGIACSAASRREQLAIASTFLVLGSLAALAFGEAHLVATPYLRNAVLLLSPLSQLNMAFEPDYRKMWIEFWCSVATGLILVWLVLGIACSALRRCWQEPKSSKRLERWRTQWHGLIYGDSKARMAFRRRLSTMNPVEWLNRRDRLQPWVVWFPIISGLGIWLWSAWAFPQLAKDGWFLFLLLFLTGTGVKIWVAAETSRYIVAARRDGALELILVSPLQVREILRGHMRSLLAQFLLPMSLVFGIHLAFTAHASSLFYAPHFVTRIAATTASTVLLVTDSLALAWSGLRGGLSCRYTAHPGTSAASRILLMPWAFTALFVLLMGARWMETADGMVHIIVMFFAAALAVDFFYALFAISELTENFRLLASLGHVPRHKKWLAYCWKSTRPTLRRGNWNPARY